MAAPVVPDPPKGHVFAPKPVSADELKYFESTEGVIQVFEFDYDAIIDFRLRVYDSGMWPFYLFPPNWILTPCFMVFKHKCGNQNIIDEIRARHVCVTQDGIRYVVEQRKTGCRYDCQDEGKVTKTVPFDKLTDCDITEPAGKEGLCCCCLVPRTLTIVNVDTASGSRGGVGSLAQHELSLVGLKDPEGFKKLVWKMKRDQGGVAAATAVGAPVQQHMMSSAVDWKREMEAQSIGITDLAPLMKQQNALLGEQVSLLKEIAANTSKG